MCVTPTIRCHLPTIVRESLMCRLICGRIELPLSHLQDLPAAPGLLVELTSHTTPCTAHHTQPAQMIASTHKALRHTFGLYLTHSKLCYNWHKERTMPISVSQWKHLNKTTSKDTKILILVAGIEQNPGPPCKKT